MAGARPRPPAARRPSAPRAPSPPAVFLCALAGQQALSVLAPGPRLLSPLAGLVGVPLMAAGVLLHLSAWRHFRRRGAPVDTLAAPSALVTDGPFRFSRNPMYLAGVAILAATATLHGTLSPWLVPPAFALLVGRAFIVPEERLLRARFGTAYRHYEARVGRWIGRRWRGRDGPSS